ncbi:MAG: glycosyltransferase [Planctomycetales bacterium]|nr:glycosyltransferase [Planctomycetales bacterium]
MATRTVQTGHAPNGPHFAAVEPPADHDLTVIVPAFNEESRLPQTLTGLRDFLDAWGVDYRVLVVDDGSGDRTATLTDSFGPRFSTISQPNSGKGAAVRNGMLRATGRVIAFTDADLPYELSSLIEGCDLIQSQKCDVVFGARDLAESTIVAKRRVMRTVATYVFREVVRNLISRKVTDTQCGLKVFSRRAARAIFGRTTIDGFAFDAEVVFLARRLGFRFERIPVTLINEFSSTLSLSRHAVPMLLDVCRVRWQAWRGEYELQAVDDERLLEDAATPTPTRRAA